jgi:hypothetical protein
MSPSARQIMELNIEYYRKKLQTETDPATRRTIAKLLREEELKLKRLDQETGNRTARPARPNCANETD